MTAPGEPPADSPLGTIDRAAEARLVDLRARFLVRAPFLGVLALDLKWAESPTVRSVACDGERVVYNPAFVAAAPAAEVEAHLFHALLHWALGHPWRGAGVPPARWRAATDLALLPMFLASPYDPRGVLPRRGPAELARGRSAEEIAAILPDEAAEESGPEAEIADCWVPPASGTDPRRRADRWRDRLVRAAQSAEASGSDPALVEAVLGAIERPRVDWRGHLAAFVARTVAADYAWVPPDRRHLARGLYLPGTRARRLGELVVALDTSGSIDPELARRFLAEVVGLAELAGRDRLLLLEADSELRSVRSVGAGDRPPASVTGRGGTDFRPVFDWLRRRAPAPSAVVYLTDGDGTFPTSAPPYPVLWAVPAPVSVPFGATVVVPGA